jgi:methylated-DNA-protein-cysteine methyltransferase related protein
MIIMGFFERVYEVVKEIPLGKVATYGQIAKILGEPRKSKMVGWALHSNPYRGIVPCHRVVNRFGELSGNFAFGGYETQKKLLEDEGIIFDNEGIINLQDYLWKPNLTKMT